MIYESIPIWPITLFFLGLAFCSAIGSVYWNTKYHDLRDLVNEAYAKKLLQWREE